MKIGVGVIGVGYAGEQHLKAYLQNPDVEVKMICSLDATVPAAAMERGIPHTTDYREITNHKAIQLVSVCTPDHLHTAPSLAAVNAGKHVFCEKPLATTIEDCAKIVEAVEKRQVKFLTGQILRFAPLFQSLKEIYDSGTLGQAVFAESDYLHDIRTMLGGWRADPQSGWDLTLAGGCHPVDLLRWIVGEVEEVHVRANKRCTPDMPFPADNVLMSLSFADGAIGKVQLTAACPRPYALNFGIHGTKGTLINNRLFTETLGELEDFTSLPLPQAAEFPHYDKEIEDILAAITDDRPTAVSARDGANSVAVCLAGIESSHKKKAVKPTRF